jgi:hypothetical protein
MEDLLAGLMRDNGPGGGRDDDDDRGGDRTEQVDGGSGRGRGRCGDD